MRIGDSEQKEKTRLELIFCSCFPPLMSANCPSRDELRIPPRPLLQRAAGSTTLPWQVAASAVSGFGLAWLLTRFLVG